MVPLVIAPSGGVIEAEHGPAMTVQRSYLTARSTEFDAVIVAGGGTPAADAIPGRDAKAGEPGATLDPRVVLYGL
jgi:catalase